MKRNLGKFEVFKLRLGPDYVLSVRIGDEWIELQTYGLPGPLNDIARMLNEEWERTMGLLYEWLHDGRFLVANTPEEVDLVRRTRDAIEGEWLKE